MVNRVIKKPLLEGSSTLPSILKINKGSHYLVNTINGDAVEQGKVYNASILNGAIGDNYNEFTIDFFADSSETMTDGVKRLYLSVINDIFITIKKDIELERYFKIFKIDDLSYQAMTMNNYDFFIKVFKIVKKTQFSNSENVGDVYEELLASTNNNYVAVNYEKISTNSIAVIKSYTTKEAWVLVDKSVIDSANDEFKLVLDFTYKFFKDETSKKLRFPDINTYSNIQDLFNTTEVSSPYYDRYLFTRGSRNMAFLNKQSEYITRSVTEIFALTNVTKSFTLNTVPQITVHALRSTNESLDLSKFKQKTVFSLSDAMPYFNSLSYEVYGYVEKTSATGTRCFNVPAIGDFNRFEIYPVLPGMVHYLFEIRSTDDSTKTKVKDITENKIRNLLKAKRMYLYNYPDLVFNTFSENNKLYLDVYSYIPYEYEAANPVTTTISTESASFELVDLFSGSTYSADYRSRFDISRSYEEPYSYPFGLGEEEYYLPYFGNDKFVETIINDTYALSGNSTLVIPQIFSNDIDLLEQKNGVVLNKYFDILSWDGGTELVEFNGEQVTPFEKRQIENTIDYSDIRSRFENIGFRSGYDAHFNAADILTNYENDNLTLCENLSSLLPDNISTLTKSVLKNQDIDVRDCFFLYIDTKDRSKYLNLIFKYEYLDTDSNTTKTVSMYQSYKTYDLTRGGKFIIPADQDNLQYVNCDRANCYVYCMK